MNTMRNGMRLIGIVCAAAGLLWHTVPMADAEPPASADEIVEKANHTAYYQGKDGRARVRMTITDAKGRERDRELTILRRDGEDDDRSTHTGEQKYYVYFHRPSDVDGMAFLVWKHIGRDDDRWLYLPALDLVKRIAASDERTSFAGSHFYYEDVSGRGTYEDTHELIRETEEIYVLKHAPKKPELVEFDFYTTQIDKDTFLPMRTEYTDSGGRVYRVYEVLEVETIDGFPTVTKAKMTDMRDGAYTVLEYDRISYNVGVSERVFTERYLRRPPRKYLR